MILHGSKKKVNISHNGFSFLTCEDRVVTKLDNEPWSGAREPTGERETRFPGVPFKSHAHARGTRDADESRHFFVCSTQPPTPTLPDDPQEEPAWKPATYQWIPASFSGGFYILITCMVAFTLQGPGSGSLGGLVILGLISVAMASVVDCGQTRSLRHEL
jgi:hypothetical protein